MKNNEETKSIADGEESTNTTTADLGTDSEFGGELYSFYNELTNDLTMLEAEIEAFTKEKSAKPRKRKKPVDEAKVSTWSMPEKDLAATIAKARLYIKCSAPSERLVKKSIREVIDERIKHYVEELNDFAETKHAGTCNKCKAFKDACETAEAAGVSADGLKVWSVSYVDLAKNGRKIGISEENLGNYVTRELKLRLLYEEKTKALEKIQDRILVPLTEMLEKRLSPKIPVKEAVCDDSTRSEKVTEVDSQTEDIKKQLKQLLKDRKIDPKTIAEFYFLYAIFVEYFKNMKLLNQVLLKEYEELEILDNEEIRKLRESAIEKVATSMVSLEWQGDNGPIERAEFRAEMLREIRTKIHERNDENNAKPPVAALCFSGGGIRSATFSLGIVQALAKHGFLEKFDYLSTVSGGGYLGGWLSAWIHRSGKEVKNVQSELATPDSTKVEPDEVTHLRSYSNYMSPKLGIASADTWTLVGSYLRNLLLNWTVVIPLAAALLLVPKLLSEVVDHGKDWIGDGYSYTAATVLNISALFGIAAVFFSTVFRPGLGSFIEKKKWLDQKFRANDIGLMISAEPKIAMLCVLPMMLLAIGATTYWSWAIEKPRIKFVRDLGEFVRDANNEIYVIASIIAIFIFVPLLNLYLLRDAKEEKGWEKIFATVLSVACLALAIAEISWLSRNPLLFGFTAGAGLLFLIGFIPARIIVYKYTEPENRNRSIQTIAQEFSISFLAASVGGLLLFLGQIGVRQLNSYLSTRPELFADLYTTFAVPAFILVYLISGTVFVGIGSKLLDDIDREWLTRIGSWLLMLSFGWIIIFSLVLLGPLVFQIIQISDWSPYSLIPVGGISGLITLVFGYFAKNASESGSSESSRLSAIVTLLPKIGAPIFAAVLIVLIVMGTDKLMIFVGSKFWLLDPNCGHLVGGTAITYLAWFFVLGAVGVFMGFWVNINKFSLHAIYRDRLIRAYLGASRGFERLTTANSFTGLDPEDNLEISKLEKQRPFHVVNMALNLTRSANLRWQNRKAESFTATPFHCGSSNMGEGSGNYRSSKVYGADKNGKSISLGTAIAISGAAASPNMGYFTQSAAVSALMALFNVRLGWWLGNPGGRGRYTYRKSCPEFAPLPMMNEAFGSTGDTNSYVYLSDGGHFDNLGLYEMVLRRAKFIIASDASADPTYSYGDLAMAIHKIRVDMGVPIEFEDGCLPEEGKACGLARIRYTAIDGEGSSDGVLLYIKPTLNENEPVDIANYRKKSPDFPHETTGDQMYSETQFESYRSLGFYMVNNIFKVVPKGTITQSCHLAIVEEKARILSLSSKPKNKRSEKSKDKG